MTDHRFDHRALDARIDSLVEAVRDLAILVEETSKWTGLHAKNDGFVKAAGRLAGVENAAHLIIGSLTEEGEPSDAFGEPA